jgi:hypothetical protein
MVVDGRARSAADGQAPQLGVNNRRGLAKAMPES